MSDASPTNEHLAYMFQPFTLHELPLRAPHRLPWRNTIQIFPKGFVLEGGREPSYSSSVQVIIG